MIGSVINNEEDTDESDRSDRLQEPRIDALGLAFHQVEHPGRGKDFTVIGDTLF